MPGSNVAGRSTGTFPFSPYIFLQNRVAIHIKKPERTKWLVQFEHNHSVY